MSPIMAFEQVKDGGQFLIGLRHRLFPDKRLGIGPCSRGALDRYCAYWMPRTTSLALALLQPFAHNTALSAGRGVGG